MMASALIVFREALEAALVISVVLGATKGLKGRMAVVAWGAVSGLLAALIAAGLMGRIAQAASGTGQALFEAGALFGAVAMLGWHNIWMSWHGAQLAAGAKRVGRDVSEGRRELSAILIVIALAVLREGSESVLFLYSLMSSGEVSSFAAVSGAALGLLVGAALGLLLYAGILRIPMRWFFSVTSTLILLLAAGMASRMAQFLIQADLLPRLKSSLWDISSVLPMNSPIGIFMHALVGYDAAPAGMQVAFYLATFLTILTGMRWIRRPLSTSTR